MGSKKGCVSITIYVPKALAKSLRLAAEQRGMGLGAFILARTIGNGGVTITGPFTPAPRETEAPPAPKAGK